MDNSYKKICIKFDEQIEELEQKRRLKKKTRGWRTSKLDSVSDVLLRLRAKGKSLQFMADFVLNFHSISTHKTTVKRHFDKLELTLKGENK